MNSLAALHSGIRTKPLLRARGTVISVNGPIVQARIPQAAIGDLCFITLNNRQELPAEVVAFKEDIITLAPFESTRGITPGSEVYNTGTTPTIDFSEELIGEVLCSGAKPLVARASPPISKINCSTRLKLFNEPPNPLLRKPICAAFRSGIRTIDALLTLGYGQRVGLFAGAGVGKSTLLGMICQSADVDVNVVALVGERGREVSEFIHNALGPEGLKRSVVVVATSDESPVKRRLAALTATSIAEYFRDRGKRVLLLVDSLTRVARAQRELGLASGELPVRQGYTPSVYTELPKLLERAGNNQVGSITAIYTVLTNGDNELDPLGEEIKSILDGHIVLDQRMIEQGVRPAIDPTRSISRLFSQVRDRVHLERAQKIVRILAKLKKDKDILLFGGSPDRELQAALAVEQKVTAFLNQAPGEYISETDSETKLLNILTEWGSSQA